MRYLKFLYNKYVLAIIIFLMVMLVFDQNDWFTQQERAKELAEAQQNIEFLKGEISVMSAELDKLKEDPAKVEQYAREKFYHKQDDEDVFLIKHDTVYVPKQQD